MKKRDECTSCNSTTGYLFLDKIAKDCVNDCPEGYYGNSTNNLCMPCDTTCKDCVHPGTSENCTSCNGTRYLELSVCN